MKMKKTLLIFGFPLLLTIALPVCAMPGWVNSRDVQTIMLVLAGAASLLVAREFATRLF